MKRGWLFIPLVVLNVAWADDSSVDFEAIPVDGATTLSGSAYYMSRGPVDREQRSALRVTFFHGERSQWLWVEEIQFGRAGSSKIEALYVIDLFALNKRAPTEVWDPKSVNWIDSHTFELIDDQHRLTLHHVEGARFGVGSGNAD